MAATNNKKGGKVFYGWWIVLAAAGMSWYGSGVWFCGFSVVFKAILDGLAGPGRFI